MKRRYAEELSLLPQVWKAARRVDVEPLARALSDIGGAPPILVASGAAAAVATYCAALHQLVIGTLARPMSPLECIGVGPRMPDHALCFFSVEGQHPDVRGAYRVLAGERPRNTLVLVGREQSSLARQAREGGGAALFELGFVGENPVQRNNALVAFAVVMYRAYAAIAPRGLPALPNTINDLLGTDRPYRTLKWASSGLWKRNMLFLLHGPFGAPAAELMEARFAEDGLLPLFRTDYHNFSHGRSAWIEKRFQEIAVLAFVAASDRALADRALEFIPESTAAMRIDVPHAGPVAALSKLVWGMLAAGVAAISLGREPLPFRPPPRVPSIYEVPLDDGD